LVSELEELIGKLTVEIGKQQEATQQCPPSKENNWSALVWVA
jgi:hypothetical protein